MGLTDRMDWMKDRIDAGVDRTMALLDRRAFLERAAAAGAGLLLAREALGQRGEAAEEQQPKKASSDELQIALVGAGAQGQVLMNSCLKIPGVRFRAVCDIWEAYNLKRAQRMLEKFGHQAAAYRDMHQMLAREKGLDAVIIATPDFWHSPQTVDCLHAGLHVYCEKEMSNTLEGARKMVRAARETS